MRAAILPVVLALFASLSSVTQTIAADSHVTDVARLTNPASLAALKSTRSANLRLWKILAALEDGRRAGMLPSKTLDEALKVSGDTGAHGQLVKVTLLRNFEDAQRASLLTPENLTLMRKGRSPIVPSGSFAGQRYEVDHVLPVDVFPELGNEIANFMLLPGTLNRRKSDAVKQRSIDLAQKMIAACVISKEQYDKAKQARKGDL